MRLPHLTARGALYGLALALLPLLSHRSGAQAPPAQTLVFPPVADTYVDAGSATTNLNSSTVLRADASPIRIIYLRFTVTGVGIRPVQRALLRLGVSAGSSVGGTVHRIGSTTWNEATVTYATRPALDGPALSTLGAVATGAVVDFDLGSAIPGDGTYSLAIDSTSSSAVSYNAAAATSGQRPQLLLTVSTAPPTLTIAQPPTGAHFFAGDPITLQASAADASGTSLNPAITWRSDLSGPLGSGPLVTAPLPQGVHTVTASVTDAQGVSATRQVGLTVDPRPAINTPPLVAITAPGAGQALATGVPARFTGSASDLEDGALTARLTWTSDRDGALGSGGTVLHPLTLGRHQITARVVDAGGLAGSATVTVDVLPALTVEVPVAADASVDAGQPTTNFGTAPVLRVDANTARLAYLRFVVAGLGARLPTRALLRLQVDATAGAESDSGGTVYLLVDPIWSEAAVTYATRPPLDGTALATIGPVAVDQVLDVDVTPTVAGNATYDFALVNASSDEATYRSRESGAGARLVLTLPGNPPTVGLDAPAGGTVVFQGVPLTLAAHASDVEDGDLGGAITWTSSLDGPLGTGASLTATTLSVGAHTLTATATDQDSLTGSADVAVRVRAPNLPPVVQVTAPPAGTTVPVGTAVTLSGRATDDADGLLSGQLRWTSSLAGPLGPGASVTAAHLGVGVHVLTAAVTDTDGATGTAAVTLTVAATPPTVHIASPAPGTGVFVGTLVTFTGSALDTVDGDLSTLLGWTSNRDGVLGAGASVSSAMLQVGTHTITAAATNSNGLAGHAEQTLVVRPPNLPPVVTIVVPTAGGLLLAGRPALLAATAVDPEDGDLAAAVLWTSSRDGALGTGAARIVPALTAGTHTLTATVIDRDGASGSASTAVTVAPPTLSFTPLADTYVDSGGASAKFGTATSLLAGTSPVRQTFLRFAVSGVAPFGVAQALLRLTVGSGSGDGSTAGGAVHTITNTSWAEATTTYTLRPAVDGPTLTTRSAVTPKQVVDFDVSAGVAAEGTYNLALVSTSSDFVRYASREASTGKPALVVTLGQNLTPLVTITSPPAGSRILPGAPVTFAATALDAESGDLGAGIAWISDRDGALGTGPAVTTAALTSGRHVITARVTDAGGRSAEAQITLYVTHPPVVRILTPGDGTVVFAAALPLTLRGEASDVEDGALGARIEWRSDLDGALAVGGVISAAALRVGTHVVTAAVTDADGLRAEARVSLQVRPPNVAPVVTITAPADRGSVPAGSPAVLTATALDDFDGDLSPRLAWISSRDGSLGTGASRTVTLSEGAHTLTAAVTDSDGAPASAKLTLTVTPTPPVVAITAPAAGTRVFVGTSLSFAATATDTTDGDVAATLRWFSDRDGLVGSGPAFTTTRLSTGTHVLTAIASDRGGLATHAERLVVIRPPNVRPSVAIVTPAAGTAVLAGKPILLGAVAPDPEDGDLATSVRWTSSRDGALGTGSPLVIAGLTAGTHTLTAAVTDRDGAPASSTSAVIAIVPTLAFPAIADTYVNSASAGTKFGTATSVLVGSGPVRQAFFRFAPTGIGTFPVGQALLRLTVGSGSSDGSVAGGSVHALGSTTWSEAATTYNTRPPITAPPLATRAKVVPKRVVDFDVTPALAGDGTYDFALDSATTDAVRYATREATTGKPQLLVTLAQDSSPFVTIAAPATGTVVDLGTAVSFSAIAADAESGDLSARVTWRSDQDGLLGIGSSLTVTLGPGPHTVTATALDAGGHAAQARVTVTVATPPVLTISTPAFVSTSVPGASVVLSATAQDAEDGDLSGSIAWTSDRDGLLGAGGTLAVATLRSGTHTITATVVDTRGQAASAAVTVVMNAFPTVGITAPVGITTVLPGTPVTLAGTASDLEDGPLAGAITWASSLDGGLGTGGSLTAGALRAGVHTITASVTDSGLKQASARVTVIVNTAPTLTLTSPADGTLVAPGGPLVLRAAANDAEEGDLATRVIWSSSLDGPLGSGGTRTVALLHSGTHTLTTAVTDATGATATARVTVVVNAPPALAITAPADASTVAPGDSVPLAATAHDTEDGDLGAAIAWTSNLDGLLGAGPALAVSTLRSGTHTVTASVTDAGGRTTTAYLTLIVNAPPTLTLLGPAPGTDVAPGDPLRLDALATDTEDGDLGAAITWTSSLDASLGTGTPLVVATLRSGTHTVTARVTDHGGRSASTTTLVVVNAPPTLTLDAPAGGAIYARSLPVPLAASAHDVEDGALSAAITWTSDLDGPLGTGGTLAVTTLRAGTHLLTATVADAGGKTATAQATIVVDAAPVVTITAPANGTSFVPGESVPLAATAIDTEDGPLSAALFWTSDLDGTLGTDATLAVTTLRPGTHTVTATATDAHGKTASDRVTVVIDIPPTVALLAPVDGATATPGTPVPLVASATDPEDGDLGPTIAWTSSLDGPLGTGATLSLTTLRSGTHTLTATATDSQGKGTAASVTLRINAAPSLAITAPADAATVAPGAPLTLAATAEDLEDGDLGGALSWASSLDGLLGTGATLSTALLHSGSHTITASVADAGGRTAAAQVTVIVNAAPAVAIDAPADGSVVLPGDVVALRATASDTEDGDLGDALAWLSSLDGVLGTGRALSLTTLRRGNHVLTALVRDAGGALTLAHVTVIVDARPTVAVVTPADGTVFAPGDPIPLATTATDPEDGDLGATVEWSSSLDGPLGTGAHLAPTILRSGTHVVTATVADVRGRVATAQVTVHVNAAPIVAVTAPAGGTILNPGAPLALATTATDLEDGDLGPSITWTSSLDGSLGTGATLVVSTLRSGVHTLTATATDAGGKTASATVAVIVDAPPSLTLDAPAPGAVYQPGETIVFAATATDPEDGTLGPAVAWRSDLDGELGTGSTLPVGTLRAGRHTITATVADAQRRSAIAQRVVLVDTPPAIEILTPVEGAVVSPGTSISLTASATDVEQGDLGAAVAWASSLDGPLGAGASLEVTTLRSGTHTLTASVTDALGRSAVATRTLLVNAAPTLTITAPTAGALSAPGSPVTFAATATDAEDGDLHTAITWTSDRDGLLGAGAPFTSTTLSSGTHVITAAVTDAGGRTATATVTLAIAPLITLNGTYPAAYNNLDLARFTHVDARAATFLAGPANLYPFNLGGDLDAVALGGTVLGQYDRSWSWDEMHNLNNAAIAFTNASFTVDGLRVDNVTDGIRPRSGGNFVVRNTWVSYARDDCLEDDHLQGGLVDDSLFDGCYEAFSARPSPAIIASGYDGRGEVLTVRNSLIRLQPMPGPRGGSADNLGTAGFFKWHNWDLPENSLSPDLALYDNVFMAERVGQLTDDRMGIPPGHLQGCANNVMVWLGPGPYPAALPDCFTVTTDRGVWDAAVANWIARHPTVGH